MATGMDTERALSNQKAKDTSADKVQRGEYDTNPSADSELRLVIFGKTGTGKSSTGNTILGRTGFEKQEGHGAKTKDCRRQQVKLNGKNVTILDTPGVSDPLRDPMETLHEISRCLLFVKPGPHALLFVVNANAKFTKEEEAAYFALRKLFASHLNSYVIVVFTHFDAFNNVKSLFEKKMTEYGDEVDKATKEGRTLPDIRKVLEDVKGKKVFISNGADEAIKDEQVLKLLSVIQDVSDANHEPFFQDPKAEREAKLLEKVIQDIKKEDFRMSDKEVWEKVKRSPEVREKGLLKALEPREEARTTGCAIL